MKLAMFLILILANCAFANERITTKSIQDMVDFVIKKNIEIGNEQILVVYDFDNTLMAMNNDLGSDQWYSWQAALIKEGKSKDRVAYSIGELFDLHYKLFAIEKMHLVESNTAKSVKQIQDLKIKSIVLTSRGSNYRGDIETELEQSELNFKESAIGPPGGYPSTFLPEGLEKPRLISYMDGIIMGSGQNKGQILRAILKKTSAKFKAIVFLDDTLKNIENLENEFKNDQGLTTFYYTHEEERVKKFANDQTQAKKDWKKLKPVLDYFSK